MNQIDPRGPRFGAGVTSVVLAAVILLSGHRDAAAALLAVQAVVFALGSKGKSPYSTLYKKLVRPRLKPNTEWEDAAPPQFAQTVGLGFAVAGLIGFVAGSTPAGLVFTSLALLAALLNASIGLCLGCEVYLLFKRLTTKGATA